MLNLCSTRLLIPSQVFLLAHFLLHRVIRKSLAGPQRSCRQLSFLNWYLLPMSLLYFQVSCFLSFSLLSNWSLNFPKLSLDNYGQIPSFFTNLQDFTILPAFHFLPPFFFISGPKCTRLKKSTRNICSRHTWVDKKCIYFEVKIDLIKNYYYQLVKSLTVKRNLLQNCSIFIFLFVIKDICFWAITCNTKNIFNS